jgi:hypothetical protein
MLTSRFRPNPGTAGSRLRMLEPLPRTSISVEVVNRPSNGLQDPSAERFMKAVVYEDRSKYASKMYRTPKLSVPPAPW